jgi:hypothetical protein
MRWLLIVPLVLGSSGCAFFEPWPDPDGGDVVLEDDGGTPDAGPRGFDPAACTWNGKRLWGRVRYVTSFPDVRVKVVTALPRLRVKEVTSFADSCGKWEIVDALPDLKVQVVDALPDLTIEYVTSFPGLP